MTQLLKAAAESKQDETALLGNAGQLDGRKTKWKKREQNLRYKI